MDFLYYTGNAGALSTGEPHKKAIWTCGNCTKKSGSDHLMLHPFAADKADAKAQAAADPVDEHAEPHAGQPHVQLQYKEIAQHHPEGPHAHDAHQHGEFGVAAAAQGVGQRKAARPEEHTEHAEPPKLANEL